MIKEKTVFILGAGASVPYGYPTGKELRYEIIQNHPERLKRAISHGVNKTSAKEPIGDAKSLAEKFEKSSTESIDLFLARNHRLSQTGKLAILLTLLLLRGREQIPGRGSSPRTRLVHLFIHKNDRKPNWAR